MTNETKAYVKEKAKELMAAYSCCAEAKAAAQQWLDAVDTEKEAEATKAFIAELEEDITTIDDFIALTDSDMGKKIFGEETAKKMNAHGIEIKAKGAKYCDCPACAAAEAILDKKEDLIG